MAPDKQITPRNAAQQLNGTTIGKRRKLSYEERARGSEGSRPLRRVFRVDGWECPHCAKPMKLRSIVIREPATTRVLSGLLRSTGPPAEA